MARLEDAAVLPRAAIFLLVSFLLWLHARAPAHAVTPRTPALQWTRGEGAARCIDPRTLAERVEELMGPVLRAPSAAEYAIEAHIEARRRGRFVVRLSVTDARGTPQGERSLDLAARDCRELDNTLVFLIALTIDPDLSLDALLPDDAGLGGRAPEEALLAELTEHPPAPLVLPAPDRPPEAPPPPPPAPALPPPPTPRKPREVGRWEASAAALIARRELPDTSAGMMVGAGWHGGQGLTLRAQLRVHTLLSPHALAETGAVRAQTFAPAVIVCSGPRWQRFRLGACMGPELALVRARGVDLGMRESSVLAAWGLLGQLDLRVALGARLSLLTQGFVRVALEQKRFVYQDAARNREAFSLRGLGGGASFGMAYDF